MELSIAARRALSVPPGARRDPWCPKLSRRRPRRSCERLPRRSRRRAAAEEEASKDGGVTGVTSKGNAAVKLAPGSTAAAAGEHHRATRQRHGRFGEGSWRMRRRRVARTTAGSIQADKETEALKTRLREAIKEKHDVAVRAREATERVAVLERALRAAGVAVP